MLKMASFIKKMLKFMMLKHSNTSRNCAVICYQTLQEAPWLMRMEKPINLEKFPKKLLKKLQKLKNLNNDIECQKKMKFLVVPEIC